MNDINPSFLETKQQRSFRQEYLKSINQAYRYEESIGIMDIGQDKKISLQDIYISLNFSEREHIENNNQFFNKFTLIDLFRNKRSVLVSGKPGSGKTTLSRSIINNLSSSNLTKMTKFFGRRLPLYFKLRDYQFDKIKKFDDFFQQYIDSISKILRIKVTRKDIEFYLNQGWCFMIFDGVDEVGSKKNRIKIRNFIVKNFNKYNNGNYILVTSRPSGIEESNFHSYTKEEADLLESKISKKLEQSEEKDIDRVEQLITHQLEDNTPSLLTLIHVAPFTDSQIREYSMKWFSAREEDPRIVQEKATDFIDSIATIPNLSILKRRPVFLSMMIHIHTTKGKLPYTRARAYQYMVEAYIEHIDIARRLSKIHSKEWSVEDKERVLEELAYK